jgi:hypothetical protein
MKIRSKLLENIRNPIKEEEILLQKMISCCAEELIPIYSLDMEIVMKLVGLCQTKRDELPPAKSIAASHTDREIQLAQQFGSMFNTLENGAKGSVIPSVNILAPGPIESHPVVLDCRPACSNVNTGSSESPDW